MDRGDWRGPWVRKESDMTERLLLLLNMQRLVFQVLKLYGNDVPVLLSFYNLIYFCLRSLWSCCTFYVYIY